MDVNERSLNFVLTVRLLMVYFVQYVQEDVCAPHKVPAVCLYIHMCLFGARWAIPFLC